MKPHLQCAEQQVSRSNLTKYCACHAERLTYLVLITYETSFTVRGATGVTIQPHQILRLPRKMTRLLYRPHIWNVISNARSNRCHYPTSPNTAPATKNDTARFQRKSPKTDETSFPMRGRSEHDPTMIRPWSDHENANRNPPRKWGYFSSSPRAFSIEKYNVSRPILHSNLHQILRLPRKVPLELHQILRLSRRKTHILSPHRIWNVIYSARSNRCHHPTSPNTAPATKNDSTALSSSHMKRHFQCAEQQVSPSNLTKYCACHEKWLDCFIVLTYETSFPMRGATGVTIQPHQILRLPRKMTLQDFKENLQKQVKRHFQCGADPTMIRAWSEHDPSMIRAWSENENANRNPPRNRGYFSTSPRAFSIVKYNVSRPILHSNLHQVLRLPRKVTLERHQVLRLPRKVTLERHQVLRLPQKVPLELHQVLRLPRKVTLELHQVLRLPRKVTLERHQVLRLPRKVTLERHQVLHLPRKVTLERHQVLHLPRKVTLELHQVLHLPRKVTLELHYSTLLDSTLLYLTLLDSTWLYLTLLDSTWLYLILLDSSWLYSTRLYLTLLYSTWLYLTLLDSTWLYLTLLDSTWLYLILLDSSWLYSTRLYLTLLYSTWLYLTLLDSTWLYLTLLDSTWLYLILPDSTWLYLTLLYSTLLDSTWLYLTLLDSAWLYLTLLDSTWLYLILLDSTWLYSTRLYLTLLYLTLLDTTLLDSTWL